MYLVLLYDVCLEKVSDQRVVTQNTLSIFTSVHKQLILTFFEEQIVTKINT